MLTHTRPDIEANVVNTWLQTNVSQRRHQMRRCISCHPLDCDGIAKKKKPLFVGNDDDDGRDSDDFIAIALFKRKKCYN